MGEEHYLQEQIEELVIGLKEQLNISYYASPLYDWYQMREIRIGLERHVDVTRYAKVDMDYFVMRQIRRGLEIGIDLYPYYEQGYSAGIIRQIRRAAKKNIDITEYVKKNYDYLQLEEIAISLEHHIEIQPYLEQWMAGVQLSEIRLGLEKGLDVSLYADGKYNWMQMREIRLGLEKGLDVSLYNSEYFGFREMREIRLGLEQQQDVTVYAKLVYSAYDMRKYRYFIAQNKNLNHKITLDIDGNVVLQNVTEDSKTQESGYLSYKMSDDGMQGFLKIRTGCDASLDVNMVEQYLKQNGIILGIDRKAIENLLLHKQYGEWVEVAVGKKSEDGKDGFYEFKFDPDHLNKPTIREDGSADYNHLLNEDLVDKDQLIAEYHPATYGVYGYNVTGQIISPQKGNDLQVLRCEGITKKDHKYYAAHFGRVHKDGYYISINRVYHFDGDYTASKGFLDFKGDVYINGSVESKVRIKASGNITINKNVADAYLESGGDIMIKRGVNANGGGMISAKGKVQSNFFENANVKAEKGVETNYILNSNVFSLSYIRVLGAKGFIIGGWIQALCKVETCQLGNSSHMESRVELGLGNEVSSIVNGLNKDIQNSESEVDYYIQKQNDIDKIYDEQKRNRLPVYRKIQELIAMKQNEISQIHDRIEMIYKDYYYYLGKDQLIVTRKIYPNITIVMNERKLRTNEEESNIKYFYEDHQIMVKKQKN